MADKVAKKYVSPSLSSEEEFIASFCRLVLRSKDSQDIIHWASKLAKRDREIADIIAKILAIGITDIQLGPKSEYIIRSDKDITKSVKSNENLYKMFQYLYKKVQRAMDNANIDAIEGMNAKLGSDEIEHDLADEGLIDKDSILDDTNPTEDGDMETRPEEDKTISRTKRELDRLAGDKATSESYDAFTDGEEEYLKSMGVIVEADESAIPARHKALMDLLGAHVAPSKVAEFKKLQATAMAGTDAQKATALKAFAGLFPRDQSSAYGRLGLEPGDLSFISNVVSPDGKAYNKFEQAEQASGAQGSKSEADIPTVVGQSIKGAAEGVAQGSTFKAIGGLVKPVTNKLAAQGEGWADKLKVQPTDLSSKANKVRSAASPINASVDKNADVIAMRKAINGGILNGGFADMESTGDDEINIDSIQGILDEEAKAGNPMALSEKMSKAKQDTLHKPSKIKKYQEDNMDMDSDQWYDDLEADEAVEMKPKTEKGIPTYGEDDEEVEDKPMVSRFSDIPILFKNFAKETYENDIAPKSIAISAVDNGSSSFAVIFDTFKDKSFATKVMNKFMKSIGFECEESEVVPFESDIADLHTFQLFFYGVSMPEHNASYDEIHNPYKRINQFKAKQAQTMTNGNFVKAKTESRLPAGKDGFVERMMKSFGDLFKG